MIIFINWCFEKHVPCTLTLHQAPSGLQIPSSRKTLIMLKETIAAIKAYMALVTVLVFTMRSRKRQIETLISMHVMKICTKSVQPRASTFFCCFGVRKYACRPKPLITPVVTKPLPMIVVTWTLTNHGLCAGEGGRLLTMAMVIMKSSHPRLRVTRIRIQRRMSVEIKAPTTSTKQNGMSHHPRSWSPSGGRT